MELSSKAYADWRVIVAQLLADPLPVSSGNVFYRTDLAIAKVAECWAVISSAAPMLVYGDFGNQGPTPAAFLIDFTTAIAVTVPIGVSES